MKMRNVLLALVMTIGVAASAFAADVTGKWVGSVETPNGPLELTYEFKAEGDALNGTVASAITHQATINDAGTEITVKATGEWGTNEYVVKKVAAAK
jgi:carbon monoxide dehydrogenase subunit G